MSGFDNVVIFAALAFSDFFFWLAGIVVVFGFFLVFADLIANIRSKVNEGG